MGKRSNALCMRSNLSPRTRQTRKQGTGSAGVIGCRVLGQSIFLPKSVPSLSMHSSQESVAHYGNPWNCNASEPDV